MTPTEPAGARRRAMLLLAPIALAIVPACSGAVPAGDRNEASASSAAPDAAAPAPTDAAQADLRPTGAPAPPPKASGQYAASTVIGKHDRALADGKKACQVDFVYAGREPEDLFWEEPCAAVTAKMMGRGELESLGRWERLDSFQQKFVEGMPGGKVLYVEGSSSASVYPVDETGTSIEVAVAD